MYVCIFKMPHKTAMPSEQCSFDNGKARRWADDARDEKSMTIGRVTRRESVMTSRSRDPITRLSLTSSATASGTVSCFFAASSATTSQPTSGLSPSRLTSLCWQFNNAAGNWGVKRNLLRDTH